MKKWIQIACGLLATLSLLFLLYGSIKFSRLESTSSLPELDIDVAGIVIEQPSSDQDKETIQILVGASLVTLILGIVGFVLSSKKGLEESR
jgi:TRAP-type C4-dicarboxylate transport system permease small subunit